jgi:hypothetical protein
VESYYHGDEPSVSQEGLSSMKLVLLYSRRKWDDNIKMHFKDVWYKNLLSERSY